MIVQEHRIELTKVCERDGIKNAPMLVHSVTIKIQPKGRSNPAVCSIASDKIFSTNRIGHKLFTSLAHIRNGIGQKEGGRNTGSHMIDTGVLVPCLRVSLFQYLPE
jgi:hypothetical protein